MYYDRIETYDYMDHLALTILSKKKAMKRLQFEYRFDAIDRLGEDIYHLQRELDSYLSKHPSWKLPNNH